MIYDCARRHNMNRALASAVARAPWCYRMYCTPRCLHRCDIDDVTKRQTLLLTSSLLKCASDPGSHLSQACTRVVRSKFSSSPGLRDTPGKVPACMSQCSSGIYLTVVFLLILLLLLETASLKTEGNSNCYHSVGIP